ncbi:hypothetical protein GGS24DRAFT_510579 [Hypoxylon argillaceum]|nr:hypothetical protein GGS24DRAFT_510579 [Hypoxylon argillaceum]
MSSNITKTPMGAVPARSVNQATSHTRPPSPSATRGAGSERPLFPTDLQPPTGFGALSTVYDHPRGRSDRDGFHTFIYAPPKASEDTAEPDNDPNTGNGLNVRMNDPLNHPLFEGYYTYEGRRYEELTGFEKRVLEMAVHYPYIAKGIMRGPFLFRTGSLTYPEAEQPYLFHQVFGVPEIFDKIVDHLIPRYEDLANLFATCQLTARRVQGLWMHLDAATNDFWGWNCNSLANVRMMERDRESLGKTEGAKRLGFSPSVIISPIRPQDQGPEQEVIRTKTGYPVTPSVKKPKGLDFGSSMRAQYSLFHLTYLNGHSIKHLILHGMPWVNVATIKRIVPEMRQLKALGVHQCFLMALDSTRPLLQAINEINKKRAEVNEPHIAADFSPYYYKGSPYKKDGTGHVGEYGILPEESCRLDTARAVTAQLLTIRNLCHEGNQDFFTPGTSFRAYLNRLPIRTLPSILECIEALHEFEIGKYHSGVGIPDWCTTGTYYQNGHDQSPLISEEMKMAMQFTLWSRLIVSCNGRPILQKQLEDWLILRGQIKLEHCTKCNTDMAVYFFSPEKQQCALEGVKCHGCELEDDIWGSIYRLYAHRRNLADCMFRNNNWKEISFRKVLKNISKAAIPAVAATPGGRPARPGRDAILARPGMVDPKFLAGAEYLWRKITTYNPKKHKEMEEALEQIDARCASMPYNRARERLEERRKKLERQKQLLDLQQGTRQRIEYSGSLDRPCRSWELNIRAYRAELAIERGQFTNNGSVPIFNLESNVAEMLGDSGGLPAYWQEGYDEFIDDDNGIGIPWFHDEIPYRRSNFDEDEVAQAGEGDTPDKSPYLDDSWEKYFWGVEDTTNSTTSSLPANSVLPHQRTTPQVVSPAVPAPPQSNAA